MSRYFAVNCFYLGFCGLLLAPCTAQETLKKPAKTVVAQSDKVKSAAVWEGIEGELARQLEEHSLPALWAGYFTSEESGHLACAGLLRSGTRLKAGVEDVVHLGSCTKAMTASMIGQLCSEERLTLDSSLGDIFSDLDFVSGSSWSGVTVTELLNHQSGAPSDMLLEYRLVDAAHPDSPVAAREALLERLCARKRDASQKYLYSNVGYIVLGHIIEEIDGRSWETSIKARIFDRLEMTTAGFGPVGHPDDSAVLADRAWGHIQAPSVSGIVSKFLGRKNLSPEWVARHIDNPRVMGPAGRVHMSVSDWSKFVLKFSLPGGHKELGISEEIWNSMLTPTDGSQDYAAGWIPFDNPDFKGSGFFHNGSNTSWYCYAVALKARPGCLLIATNCYSNSARKACDDIARWIAKRIK